jgi:WD40 repeat protein
MQHVVELTVPGWNKTVFNRDGTRLFTCSRTAITCWDTHNWQEVYELPAMISSSSSTIEFSHDGQLAAIFQKPGRIRLIRSDTGEEICTLEPPSGITHVSSLCFSPDTRFLSASCGARGLCLWNLGEIRRRLGDLGLDWSLPAEPQRPDSR